MPERLVFLHGFAGAPAAWDRTLAAWPSARAPIRPAPLRPALPGHDPSCPASAEATFREAVEALARGLPSGERLGLIGYSLGARLSLGLTVAYPERFSRITLIGVNPGLDDAARPARRVTDEAWATMLERQGLTRFLEAWLAQPLFASQASLPAEVRDEQAAWRRRLSASALAAAMRQLSLGAMPDYRAALEALPLPVQLVVGASDEKFRRIADGMQVSLPSARLDVIAGAGHNVPLEAPERLAARLADFHD